MGWLHLPHVSRRKASSNSPRTLTSSRLVSSRNSPQTTMIGSTCVVQLSPEESMRDPEPVLALSQKCTVDHLSWVSSHNITPDAHVVTLSSPCNNSRRWVSWNKVSTEEESSLPRDTKCWTALPTPVSKPHHPNACCNPP